ncbi:hypothetical protein ES702_00555 [subsurface metagenome]
MKLSAWHKKRGDEVFKGCCKTPDLVYVSCVFSWNRGKALGMAKFYPNAKVVFGGVGLDLKSELPYEVEYTMPDYSLYGSDYSMGFSSRGCIRNCPWCIVPEKEGWIREHAPITEFLHPDHKKLLLFDNNFPASPSCISKLEWLADWGGKVSFNQGLDIRLIDENMAYLLTKVRYYDSDFNERRLYFSYDQSGMEFELKRGVKHLEAAGVPMGHLMFYMLVGFNSSHQDDLRRFNFLRKLGVDPYVMVYNKRRDDPWLTHFSRWVNLRFYTWPNLKTLNQFLVAKGQVYNIKPEHVEKGRADKYQEPPEGVPTLTEAFEDVRE